MLINEISSNYEPSYSHWLEDPNVAYVFKTGRGSTYAYYNKGPHAGGTQRDRSGLNHSDKTTGMQPVSTRTIFMKELDAINLNSDGNIKTGVYPIKDKPGYAHSLSLEPYGPRPVGSIYSKPQPYKLYPEIGLLPVELRNDNTVMHIGNEITEVIPQNKFSNLIK